MSASNQPPRSVNFPSLLVSEDEGKGISMPEAREDGSSIHSWIDSDFVPSWLRPFSLDATTRFTRTPDHLLRKTEEMETGPGFCIGGTGWHFLDMPRDRDDDLSSFPSLKADLDALEMAFSEVQGAARLAQEDNGTGTHLSAGGSFSAEAGLIASFVSAELGTDADEEPSAVTEFSEASWLEHEWTGADAFGVMSEDMAALNAPEADPAATETLLPAFEGSETPESVHEPVADMDHAADDGFEDVPTDMTEFNTAEVEAEAGDVETVVEAGMMAPMVDVISPLMAASWAAERVELGDPPAHLLALRQAIILGDAGFAHRPAPDQDLHALPVLDEDDSTDAVMLSDWDQTLPAAPETEAAILEADSAEADVAVMLSDFEPEADSAAEMVSVMEMPAVAPAGSGVEMIADAVLTEAKMDDTDEEAWEEAFLSSVYMTGQNDAGMPVQDLPASEDTGHTDTAMPDMPSVAVAGLLDSGMEEAAQSDDSVSDDEPVLVNTVLAADMEDDAAELADDAFEDILLTDGASAETLESPALDASISLPLEEEAAGVELAVASAPVTAPSALAFTAPVIGAAFGWQPYQQSIASDLMRFGTMAAPAAIVPAVMPASAPAAQAEEVAAPLAMTAPVEASVELVGQDVAVQDADAVAEEIAMAEGTCAYQLPDLELLCEPPQLEPDYELSEEALDQNSTALQQILRDFGVRGEIIDANPGPVVTLYEFEPAPGVKSSRVIGLADDIARSMSAISARVAVVPGRNVIGIELPNKRRDTVWLRELLSSQEFGEARTKLGIGLGKTIGGEPVIADLARMPHLLVAGTTGSGKSVAINTMILSLLYQHTPEQCRLIMIDPKMLELSIYEGIPHLLTPVVTDPKKAIIALKWAVKEMEDRYRKMARLAVRNIDGFNARMAEARAKGEIITRQVQVGFDKESGEALFEEQEMDLSPLPYIVIIVDEMADLMMVAGKEIEGAIQRLAQMARAAGIHLVMATQRPSVDVITGTIKANFPTRISFQVTSKIDSRTILGEMGAETLLGQGDMLFMAGGGRIQRVHGPFVSDAEVEHVVNFLKTQGGPEYLDEVVTDEEADGPSDGEDGAVFDKGALGEGSGDLYDQAVAIVMRDRKASTSYIQRRLQVGYNKAASLMERMENESIVGPANHAGKREILAFSRGD